MRVKSDLADLQIELGSIRRDGPELVVESAPESSIDARIRVNAAEARGILARMLRSGAVWGFLLRLPFARLRRARDTAREGGRPALREGGDAFAPQSNGNTGDNPAWRARRGSVGLNKPW